MKHVGKYSHITLYFLNMLQFIYVSVDEHISSSQIFTLQIILLGASLSTPPCRHMG